MHGTGNIQGACAGRLAACRPRIGRRGTVFVPATHWGVLLALSAYVRIPWDVVWSRASNGLLMHGAYALRMPTEAFAQPHLSTVLCGLEITAWEREGANRESWRTRHPNRIPRAYQAPGVIERWGWQCTDRCRCRRPQRAPWPCRRRFLRRRFLAPQRPHTFDGCLATLAFASARLTRHAHPPCRQAPGRQQAAAAQPCTTSASPPSTRWVRSRERCLPWRAKAGAAGGEEGWFCSCPGVCCTRSSAQAQAAPCLCPPGQQALLALGGLAGYVSKGSTASLGARTRGCWAAGCQRVGGCYLCLPFPEQLLHCSLRAAKALPLMQPPLLAPVQAGAWAPPLSWLPAPICLCSRTTVGSCAAPPPSPPWVRS